MSRSEALERQLILACVHARTDVKTVHALARNVTNWDRVVERATACRVAPWLDARLHSPALHGIAARSAVRQVQLRTLLVRILSQFEAAHVDAIVLKGMAMISGVYEEPQRRMVGDIDLLLRANDIPRAGAELRALGATQLAAGSPTLHAPPFVFDRDLRVELHTAIVPLKWGRGIPPERLWRTPGRMLLPAHLILHAAIHAILGHLGVGMLYQFRDIHEIIRRFSADIDWDTVVDDAETTGLSWPVSLALQGAVDLVGADVPDRVIAALASRHSHWSARRSLINTILPRLAVTFDRIGPVTAPHVIGTLPELLIGEDEWVAWTRVGTAFVTRARRWIRRARA